MVVCKPLAETLIINAPPITLELSMIKIQEQYCRRIRKLEKGGYKSKLLATGRIQSNFGEHNTERFYCPS